MSLRCWLWGHASVVPRMDAHGTMRHVCPTCGHAQSFTELPEITRNKQLAAQRAERERERAIVAERERKVEERRQREQIRLVKRA